MLQDSLDLEEKIYEEGIKEGFAAFISKAQIIGPKQNQKISMS